MYLPKRFLLDDQAEVRKLIEQNSFATVLSFPLEQMPFINHLPVIFSTSPGEESVLLGHMARQNPQWQHFKSNPEGLVIIHGAHTYITPRWYKSGRDVPTWNYAVAHLHGKIELVEEYAGQVEILKRLTDFFEKGSPSPWEFELPDDLLNPQALTAAIVSFKFHIKKIAAKFKLSQNRSDDDRQGVIDGLKERTDEMSQLVREMMLGI